MFGPQLAVPGPENDWHTGHVTRLADVFARVTGRDLVAGDGTGSRPGWAEGAWEGGFALLSHRGDGLATLELLPSVSWSLTICGNWIDQIWSRRPSAATAPDDDIAEQQWRP